MIKIFTFTKNKRITKDCKNNLIIAFDNTIEIFIFGIFIFSRKIEQQIYIESDNLIKGIKPLIDLQTKNLIELQNSVAKAQKNG